MSDLFEDQEKVQLRLNLQEHLQEISGSDSDSISLSLENFQNLKEYKNKVEHKLKTFKEMIAAVQKSLIEIENQNIHDTAIHNSIISQEKSLFSEIESQKSSLLEKIKHLELDEHKLNHQRKKLKDEIKKQTEIYSKLLSQSLEKIQSKYSSELQEIRNQYSRELKSFHIDFNKVDKEEVGKRELLKNLSDMTRVRKIFKEKEIELIRTKLTTEYSKLISQFEILKSLNQEHKLISNQYQQTKLEEYNLLNIFFSFEKVLENFKENKKTLMQEKLEEYNLRLNENLENKIRPHIRDKILKTNSEEILKMTENVISNDNNLLKLQENKKFISDYYRSKNTEALFLIKYLLYKQKETPIKEEEKLKKYSELISRNINELYHYSTMFDDQYTKNLIEKAELFSKKLPSKVELIKSFDKIKHDIFFDMFYYSYSNKISDFDENSSNNSSIGNNFDFKFTNDQNNILKFFFCGLLSKTTNFWINLYSPFYNSIQDQDSEIIKKVKALSFINYYLGNENYSNAYEHLQYLIPHHEEKIKDLVEKIEIMTKHEMVIGLLETHFSH